MNPPLLTEFSKGGGCSCKIAPKVLEEILHSAVQRPQHAALLVGHESNDDAAVYDLGNGTALISSTDFFSPLVNDPLTFGKIAAANAISDIYAMGGKPLVAIAILGWPVEKLSPATAQQVIEGGRTICEQAGIPLAGGHSIDNPEPIFGLAVTGIVPIENLKRNNTAQVGDWLLLTKPLGTGVLASAEKKGFLDGSQQSMLFDALCSLNEIGTELGAIKGVHAMTDITGFGLMGHLMEMVKGSNASATLYYERLPLLPNVRELIGQRVFPDATTRNWSAYQDKIRFEKGVNVMEAFTLLPDPQTNGGLLISVAPDTLETVQSILTAHGYGAHTEPIGKIIAQEEKTLIVYPN
ncbi:MAG: selenide, water dikinase SelD [Chitinophagia bacterium]|nr:selenide, water dikinase SelD [Chitinophagia bacterium]